MISAEFNPAESQIEQIFTNIHTKVYEEKR